MNLRDDWTFQLLLNVAGAAIWDLLKWLAVAMIFGAVRARCVRFFQRLRKNRGTVLPFSGESISASIGAASLTAAPPVHSVAVEDTWALQFVNTSTMMQREAFQRQHDHAARFGMY